MPVPSLPAIKTTGWAIDPPLLRAGETITITSGGKTITETTSSGPMAYVNGNGNGYGYLCTDNGHGHYSVTIPASETR
jgi:hypothetical protein